MPLNVGYIQASHDGVLVEVRYNPQGAARAAQPLRQTGSPARCIQITNPENRTGTVEFTGPGGTVSVPLNPGTTGYSLPQAQSTLKLRTRGDVQQIDILFT
jgi:hypothetical protein